jgi:hypothetical protein
VSKSDSLSLVILHQAFLYVWLCAHTAHAESWQTSQAWMVMAFPNAGYRKAHLPIFAPTQIMVEFRIWGVANPWCIHTVVQPAVDDWLQYFEGLDLRGHPHFWEHLQLAPRGTEAYHHPSMSLREPHTTQVYNCFKPQNRRASAQISDKLRFWSRICGECHEASPPIKPHAPLTFPLLEQLPATTNVSCNTLCERT